MGKVSDKLALLVASRDPGTEVNLHVMLQKDLAKDSTETLIDSLSQLATDRNDVKMFPLSGIVTLRGNLESIEKIAQNPNVVWIDQDSEAPMEELLDE